ncbi:MAG: class I SAM-dependent methyltransferase [Alphaproteobacteria bacterium]|nr:class I SAM-dependent methyltransferase [Alphaproteobacteria bacterium]
MTQAMTRGDQQARNTQGVLSMRSGGYYSERTAGARIAINNALPMVRAALPPAPGAKEPLRLADYGSADGGTSREMWYRLIEGLRDAGDHREIVLTYTDLPSNDFSTLFRTMQGLQGDPAFAYQKAFDGVSVHGCGTGFHSQLFPKDSLDFGFSATAMHYVSETPCDITNHVHAVGAVGEEAERFAAQARKDWERILLARAAELKPGGRFLCVNFGIDEEGRYLGNTGGVQMFDMFATLWSEMRDEGRITPEDFDRATFAQYYRTQAEFTAPLLDETSPVSRAGLRLVSAGSRHTRCPYEQAFAEAGGAMSAAEFAANLVPTLRSWSETVFRTALSGRPAEEAQSLVDLFYRRYEDRVAADPAGHAMDYIHIVLEIEKTSV